MPKEVNFYIQNSNSLLNLTVDIHILNVNKTRTSLSRKHLPQNFHPFKQCSNLKPLKLLVYLLSIYYEECDPRYHRLWWVRVSFMCYNAYAVIVTN